MTCMKLVSYSPVPPVNRHFPGMKKFCFQYIYFLFNLLSFSAADNAIGGISMIGDGCGRMWIGFTASAEVRVLYADSMLDSAVSLPINPLGWSCNVVVWYSEVAGFQSASSAYSMSIWFAHRVILLRLSSTRKTLILGYEPSIRAKVSFVPISLRVLTSNLFRHSHCTPSAISLMQNDLQLAW